MAKVRRGDTVRRYAYRPEIVGTVERVYLIPPEPVRGIRQVPFADVRWQTDDRRACPASRVRTSALKVLFEGSSSPLAEDER